MGKRVNLDRAALIDIVYPMGVDATLRFIDPDVVTITDTYQVLIAQKNGKLIKTIEETDAELSKSDNAIIWNVKFEHDDADIKMDNTYQFEIRNKTQDFIEYRGLFSTIKTINHG